MHNASCNWIRSEWTRDGCLEYHQLDTFCQIKSSFDNPGLIYWKDQQTEQCERKLFWEDAQSLLKYIYIYIIMTNFDHYHLIINRLDVLQTHREPDEFVCWSFSMWKWINHKFTLLMYQRKNFTPVSKRCRFFCWQTIFFLSRTAIGAVFRGVCGFRHYQLVVLQTFTWSIPHHQCTKLVCPHPQNLPPQSLQLTKRTLYWMAFKTD